MANLARVLSELGEVFPPEQMRGLTRLASELSDQVTREDFGKLRATVEELAEAQKRGEARLDRVEVTLGELVEAQKRTEIRLEKLAEAQEQTERRLTRLEHAVEKLVKIVQSHDRRLANIERELGGLSHVVGYRLEDDAYLALPGWLAARLGVRVTEPLHRRFLDVAGRRVQVNVWGLAESAEGRLVRVVGEAKSQLSIKHLDEVARLLRRTKPAWGTPEALVLLVTYMAEPEVAEEAARRGWVVVHSWELRAGVAS